MDTYKKHIIKEFVPQGGRHCITTALKQIFNYYGHPLTETMLLGLGCGFGFGYINLANAPILTGRCKVFEFEKNLAETLGIEIHCKKPKQYVSALRRTKEMLDQNKPVLVYVDMPYLKYQHLPKSSHFGGHAIVIFGYDEEKQVFYVSDRDNHDFAIDTPKGEINSDYHLVSFEEMEQARSSKCRPFPANSQYLEIDLSKGIMITPDILFKVIQNICENMLMPPAHLLGVEGIEKFSKEVLKWKSFDEEKLRRTGTTNFFQINHRGGTGGGIFRNMWGEFLVEASSILQNESLEQIGRQYMEVALQWEQIADNMKTLGQTGNKDLLPHLSEAANSIKHQEESLLKAIVESL